LFLDFLRTKKTTMRISAPESDPQPPLMAPNFHRHQVRSVRGSGRV
jgi:hypothetical protein